MRKLILAIPAICLLASAVVHADEPKFTLKTEKADPPKDLKASFSSLLSDQSLQLLDEKGGAFATFWFRKTIPCKAAPEQVKNGLTYREIPQSSVVGVVQFSQAWVDFRKQKIPVGTYSLRLGFQPMDGDHQGTAPYGEFCLLVPAGKDEKPDTLEAKALHELSAFATGGTHPGVMLLFPNNKPEDEPKLAAKPNAVIVLNVKRPIDADGKATGSRRSNESGQSLGGTPTGPSGLELSGDSLP
jgi:hypothetical protein